MPVNRNAHTASWDKVTVQINSQPVAGVEAISYPITTAKYITATVKPSRPIGKLPEAL